MYLALYRKYRPQTFDDVVSQEHITKTLKNQITSGKTAHAYLFTGSRGTGKTTCAKIFAKAVNCPNAHNGEPCLECDVCKGIEDGSVTDVVEIDAASNNGVENIRELRETAFFTPTFAKYRVYIIDEVHMLSVPAFNALLKIMEEPPAHVKFVLATTEVHKVPITVISRCQRFDFKRIKDEDIASRLKYIAQKENVALSNDAADLIARLADGALRDGISLLDRILSSTDNVTIEAVENSVGVAGREYLFELCDCILKNETANALAIINELYMGSKDLQRLCSELINHFRNLMLIKATNGDCTDLVKATASEFEKLKIQQEKASMGQILTALTRLQECYDKIGKSQGKRIEFEMCIIKLCTPKEQKVKTSVEPESDKTAPQKVETVVIPKLPKGENVNEVIIPVLPKEEEQTEKAEKVEQVVIPELPKEPVIPTQTTFDTAEKIVEEIPPLQEPKSEEIPLPEEIPIPQSETEVAVSDDTEPKTEKDEFLEVAEWSEIVELLIKFAPHLAMLKNESKALTKGDSIYIGISSSLMIAQLKRDGNISYLKQAINDVLGRDYRIKLKSIDSKNEEKKPIDTFLANARAIGIEIEEN